MLFDVFVYVLTAIQCMLAAKYFQKTSRINELGGVTAPKRMTVLACLLCIITVPLMVLKNSADERL